MYQPFVFFALMFGAIVGIAHMIYLGQIAEELRKIREHLAKS